MKNKNILIAVVSFLLCITGSSAQSSGEWSKPLTHPCFQGIMISVVNMGKGSGENDYLWGIKFKNNYDVPVTFKYKLSIGEKITSKYGGNEAPLKRKGDQNDTRIDGNDKFTAKLYHNSSEEWYLYVWDVCFDGMRCGGADECFADCDKDKDYPKPNQPCGLSSSPSLNAPEINNEPKEMSGKQAAGPKKEGDETPDIGETSNWIRDDKKVEVNMGKTEKGIYWKRKNDKKYTFFEKLPSGAYRFEVGKDTYIIQFVSATKIQFSENGTVTNHYNIVADEEDDGDSKVRSGIWDRGGGTKAKITVTKDGLTYHNINSLDDGSPFFKRISATEYRRDNPDGILFCTLKLKEDKKLHYTCNDKPDSYVSMGELSFISADEEKIAAETDNKISMSNNSEWKYTDNEKSRMINALSDDVLVVGVKGVPYSSLYKKKSENVYELASKDGSKQLIEFISNTRYKIKSTSPDTFFELVNSGAGEEKPKVTAQSSPAMDIKGTWNYLGFNLFSDLELTTNGEKLNASFLFHGKSAGLKNFPYTKVHQYFYTYDTDTTKSWIRYINDTTLSISYQHRNLKTLSYFTRPAAAPIVKQENKPVTETQEALKGKITHWECRNGGYGTDEMEMKDDGLYFSDIYSDEDRSKPAFFKKVSATTYVYISKVSGGHRIVFQGEGRMYSESYHSVTGRTHTHCDYYLVK
jgi:hypothetical protein